MKQRLFNKKLNSGMSFVFVIIVIVVVTLIVGALDLGFSELFRLIMK